MRLKYFAGLLFLILFACSKGGSSNTDMEEENGEDPNLPPTATQLIFPTDKLICSGLDLEFEWEAVSDPEGDTVVYEVTIATDADFNNVTHMNQTVLTSRIYNLDNATTYFWRIRALDSEDNASDYSEVWDFFTEREAELNTLPTIPALVAPTLRGTITQPSTNLSWSASDADGDVLVYDVYFSETNPPEILAENISANILNVDLTTNSTYYWKVVAKDTKGGVSFGQVWSFRAE